MCQLNNHISRRRVAAAGTRLDPERAATLSIQMDVFICHRLVIIYQPREHHDHKLRRKRAFLSR